MIKIGEYTLKKEIHFMNIEQSKVRLVCSRVYMYCSEFYWLLKQIITIINHNQGNQFNRK